MTGRIARSDVAIGAALAVTNVASLLAVSGDLPSGVDRPADPLGVALLTFAGLPARRTAPVARRRLVASLGTIWSRACRGRTSSSSGWPRLRRAERDKAVVELRSETEQLGVAPAQRTTASVRSDSRR